MLHESMCRVAQMCHICIQSVSDNVLCFANYSAAFDSLGFEQLSHEHTRYHMLCQEGSNFRKYRKT